MKAGKKIDRRRFITFLGWSTVVPFAWLAGKMESRNRQLQPVKELELPQPASDGVFFHGEAILVSKEGLTYALSSRCTHLGCRIVEAKDGLLICPCHGSRYDMHGGVVKGPAAGNLKRLELRTSATDGKLHITL